MLPKDGHNTLMDHAIDYSRYSEHATDDSTNLNEEMEEILTVLGETNSHGR